MYECEGLKINSEIEEYQEECEIWTLIPKKSVRCRYSPQEECEMRILPQLDLPSPPLFTWRHLFGVRSLMWLSQRRGGSWRKWRGS